MFLFFADELKMKQNLLVEVSLIFVAFIVFHTKGLKPETSKMLKNVMKYDFLAQGLLQCAALFFMTCRDRGGGHAHRGHR